MSLHYLLRGAVERGADLYSSCKEAYELLKGAVVGGPSIEFTRYHEAGVTKICSHQIEKPRICKTILGYDANALYLSTILRDMPSGKERVVHYTCRYTEPRWKAEVTRGLVQRLKDGTWFGFAEVDVEIPEDLRPKFEEMCPFFYNKGVPAEAVPKRITYYLQRTGRPRGGGGGREKAGGGAVRGEAVGVCPSAALVWGPRRGNQGGPPNNRLPGGQDLSLVRGVGEEGAPYRTRGKEKGAASRGI